MQASTRLLALRAAAKVALSASILGCGGATIADEHASPKARSPELEAGALPDALADALADAPASTIHHSAQAEASTGRDVLASVDARADVSMQADAVANAVCPGATEDPNATVSEGTFACCATYLDGQTSGGFPQLDASAPPSKACCAAVIAYVDHVDGGNEAVTSMPLFYWCRCNVLAPGPQSFCTPWGPPVPPAMIALADAPSHWGVA